LRAVEFPHVPHPPANSFRAREEIVPSPSLINAIKSVFLSLPTKVYSLYFPGSTPLPIVSDAHRSGVTLVRCLRNRQVPFCLPFVIHEPERLCELIMPVFYPPGSVMPRISLSLCNLFPRYSGSNLSPLSLPTPFFLTFALIFFPQPSSDSTDVDIICQFLKGTPAQG